MKNELRLKGEVDRITIKKEESMDLHGRPIKMESKTKRSLLCLFSGGQAWIPTTVDQIAEFNIEEGEEYIFRFSVSVEQNSGKGSDFVANLFKPKKLLSVESTSSMSLD